jgi:hypothetical protein
MAQLVGIADRAHLDDALVLEGEGDDDTRLPRVAQDDGQLAIDLGELGLEGIREEAERTHREARRRWAADVRRRRASVKRCACETGEPRIL